MTTEQIRFTDGSGYEQFMGKWSQRVGETFIAWLAAKSGLAWLDVGCGNGAFTETILQRCPPSSVQGIDPSGEQIAFARTRFAASHADFREGDAMALPYSDHSFDIAVMPLVIFFVPNPAKGVAEMARVVRPGGMVTAYGWDLIGGGFPYAAVQAEMRALDIPVLLPPSPEASQLDNLHKLWTDAGLEAVETKEIKVQRTFKDFEEYWETSLKGPSFGSKLAALKPEQQDTLKSRLRDRFKPDAEGKITCSARANAVKGLKSI